MVAEVVMGVAEAVPRVGFPLAVGDLLEPVQRPFAIADGLAIVVEQGELPANRVEGVRLSGDASGRLEQIQRLPGVAERLAMPVPPLKGLAENEVCVRESGPVTNNRELVQGAFQMPVRLVVPGESGADPSEVAMRVRLPRQVAVPACHAQRKLLGGVPVRPERPPAALAATAIVLTRLAPSGNRPARWQQRRNNARRLMSTTRLCRLGDCYAAAPRPTRRSYCRYGALAILATYISTGRFRAKSVPVHEYAGVKLPQLAASMVKLAMPSTP
jgi:hypothetical protein